MTSEVHAENLAAPRFRSFTWQLTIRLALLVTITSVIVLVAGGLLLAGRRRTASTPCTRLSLSSSGRS